MIIVRVAREQGMRVRLIAAIERPEIAFVGLKEEVPAIRRPRCWHMDSFPSPAARAPVPETGAPCALRIRRFEVWTRPPSANVMREPSGLHTGFRL